LVNSQIYFLGGRYSLESVQNVTRNELYTISLDQSFSTNGLLQSGSVQSTEALSTAPFKYDGGAFWYNNNTLFMYSGLGPDSIETFEPLYSFHIDDDAWTSERVAGGDFQKGNRKYGQYASDLATGQSFFSGGSDTSITGLVSFDASDRSDMSWFNDTSPAPTNARPRGQRMGAEAVFLPFGGEGVLLYIGGYDVRLFCQVSIARRTLLTYTRQGNKALLALIMSIWVRLISMM
jgi:hypothetical protein